MASVQRVLIAEDEPASRARLAGMLTALGYEVQAVADGLAAWEELGTPNPPRLVVLDWEMPGLSGPEVCERLAAQPPAEPPYVVLVTVRAGPENVVAGLKAGANDYLAKPYNRDELAARLQVGCRVLDLQRRLTERVRDLEQALDEVRRLQGLLPICGWCHKVRDGQDYWQQIDEYFRQYAGVNFTHGMCPDCLRRETAKHAGAPAITFGRGPSRDEPDSRPTEKPHDRADLLA